MKKKHTPKDKLKVALAAIKEDKVVAQICSEFSVVSSQVYAWKKVLEEQGSQVFEDPRQVPSQQQEIDRLHRIIGQITAERDFLSRVLKR